MATQTDTADRGAFSRGLRLIGSYIRMHPGPFFLSVGGAFLYAVGSIGSTAVLGRVTNQILKPAFSGGVSTEKIWLGAAAILGVAAVRSLGIGVRRYFSGMSGEKVMRSMRLDVAERYKELPAAYHREKPTGELMAHMEADVDAAVDVFFPVPFAAGVIFLVLFAIISLRPHRRVSRRDRVLGDPLAGADEPVVRTAACKGPFSARRSGSPRSPPSCTSRSTARSS